MLMSIKNCHGKTPVNQKNYFDIAREQCEIVRAYEEIANPIIGYLVRDYLGREIFGDNTTLVRRGLPSLSAGRSYVVTFRIDVRPNLREEEYSLSVAVADGMLNNYRQCHWLHDAVIFKSVPVRTPGGIFSVLNTDVIFFQVGN